MAFDGLMISALRSEFSCLLGARIDKIHQPENDEIILHIRGGGQGYKLLLSANASCPRIHFVNSTKENPLTAPMFCMFLRKHIGGGRITDILQPDFERMLVFRISAYNEMGDNVEKELIIEIMGKHSNIILVEDGVILESIKHVSYDRSSVRQILPGRAYASPPHQGKLNPQLLTKETFLSHEKSIFEKYIFQNYTGVAPFSSQLMAQITKSDGDYERLFDVFYNLLDSIENGNAKPYIILNEVGTPKEFSTFGKELYDIDYIQNFEDVSSMLEYYYANRDNTSRISQKSQELRRLVSNNIERCVKKKQIQQNTLEEIADRDALKVLGELLTANIHAITHGSASFTCQNYYEEDYPEITIKLDPQKSPAENAQSYFRLYNKQKRTFVALQPQILQNQEELSYLEGVLVGISHSADDADLAQIREELHEQGFIKKKAPVTKGAKKKPKPLEYISSDGYQIFVGKNNKQNDLLTKSALQDDIWLHTKDIPGSHVIVKAQGGKVSDTALNEAAMLAAYYSKAKNSANIPIDYCPKKHVKKPSGAKAGMVIYDNFKTAYITPDEKLINSMAKIESRAD